MKVPVRRPQVASRQHLDRAAVAVDADAVGPGITVHDAGRAGKPATVSLAGTVPPRASYRSDRLPGSAAQRTGSKWPTISAGYGDSATYCS
jgi:hypothetical protein